MPGFLTGLAQGIAANRETDLQTKRLGIEQQRADAESARFDAQQRQQQRENSRQDLQDQLSASGEEMKTLFDSNRSLYGALNNVPEAPKGLPPPDPNDPQAKQWYAQRDAREAALNSPEYKAAAEKIPAVLDQAKEIAGRHNALVGKLAGTFSGEVKDDAQVAKFNLEHGGPDAVSGRQLAHLAMADTGNNPAIFVKDPKTGQSPAEAAANKLIQAAQTHNFDGLHDEIGLLLPELHMGIGHELSNGNTVTKTPVTAMFLDPKDPTKVHVSYALHHEDDQGNPGEPINSPHMADDGFTIPLQTLVDRAHGLVQKVGMFSDPATQRKLAGAVQNGDTALHDFFNVARAHGVAEAGPITRELKKGVSLVTQEPGKAPQVTMEAKQYVPAQEAIFNELRDAYESGDPDRIAAAQMAAQGIHPSKYQPGETGGGGGTGVGATKTKYTASDRKDLVDSLQAAVAQRLGGADLSDVQKGEDVFGASRIPDRAKAAAARNVFLQARNRMDADIRAGKQNVDIEDYLPKGEGKGEPGGAKPGNPQAASADIRAQYQQGKINREQAINMLAALVDQHGHDKTIAHPTPAAAAPRAAAAAAVAKPAQAAKDQGAAIRGLADPVNMADYVKTGPSGSKRDLATDLKQADSALGMLQSSMGSADLPEDVRADMQHRFAAELMRKNELLAIQKKLTGG